MIELQKVLPPGYRFRNVWFPGAINPTGLALPRSVHDGNDLIISGAQKRTTVDGVHFIAGGTSSMEVLDNALQNGKAAIHFTMEFVLDSTFNVAYPGDIILMQKWDGGANFIQAKFTMADGKLHWIQNAGGVVFDLASTTVSWVAGTRYIVTFSFTDAPAQRILVNGVLENSSAVAAVVTPPSGNMYLMSQQLAGGASVPGTLSRVVIGVGATAVVALTAAEEQDLARGIPPPTAKVQYEYIMDEGMGITCNDRGSAGGNATLSATCTWKWGVCRQPVVSLDGINDYAASAAGVANITPPLTINHVLKLESTYNGLSGEHNFFLLYADGANFIRCYYRNADNKIHLLGTGAGAAAAASFSPAFSIAQYVIMSGVLDGAGNVTLLLNGVPVAAAAGMGILAGLGRVLLGTDTAPPLVVDVSKTLHLDIVHGAMSAAAVKTYHRYLDQKLGMGIGV